MKSFEEYLSESRTARQMYDLHAKEWLRLSRNADNAFSKSKNPGDEHHTRAIGFETEAEKHYKEMISWADRVKAEEK